MARTKISWPAIVIAIVLVFSIVMYLCQSSKEDEETYDDSPKMTVQDKVFLDSNVENTSDTFPYNYWYLTAYPRYLQTWKWGRGQGCGTRGLAYPYYWPHEGRGWQLTGYGRRQGV